MSTPPRIEAFDSHVHAGPGEPGDPLAPPPAEELWRRLSSASITRAVIFAPNRRDGYRVANQEVMRIAATSRDRWVPFLRMRCERPHPWGRRARLLAGMGMNARSEEYSATEVEQLLSIGGFRGLKLNLALDGMPAAGVLDMLAKRQVPVVLHTGEGIEMREVEGEFLRRGIPTVLAHLGTYPLRRQRALDCLALLDRYSCAWADTAMVFFESVLEESCRRFPDRILFGTDAPGVHPEVGRASIDALPLDEGVRRNVMGENLIRLLDLARADRTVAS